MHAYPVDFLSSQSHAYSVDVTDLTGLAQATVIVMHQCDAAWWSAWSRITGSALQWWCRCDGSQMLCVIWLRHCCRALVIATSSKQLEGQDRTGYKWAGRLHVGCS